MKILLMHPNFPAQFLNLCLVLGPHPDYEIVFLTAKRDREMPGVRKIYFDSFENFRPKTHHYIQPSDKAIHQGQSAYKAALELKKTGFEPDIVLGHSGWGSTLFMKDLFPQAALICYFEWFYHAHGTDMDFDPEEPMTLDSVMRTRTINLPFLFDLAACDAGMSPTRWQHQQFPAEYSNKIWVCHDGVQSERLIPEPSTKIYFPDLGIDLRNADEVVTYVGRGMERYRGFPQFMQAMEKVLKRRPHCHVVIVGADRIAYGGRKPNGYASYKEWARKEIDLDWTRVHFTGLLPRNRYLQVLQASSVHVYLTFPFVLSWSMLEAMSCGCLLVASNTPPVTEVITDGENGLLTDFFDVQAIADRTEEALACRPGYGKICETARQTILDRYDWKKILPQQVSFFRYMAGQSHNKKILQGKSQ